MLLRQLDPYEKPKTIAKTKLKYFIGVTKEASASCKLCVNNKFAILPQRPKIIKINISIFVGIIQSQKIEHKPIDAHKKVK